jgi:UDP-glucose 4-epimerase
MKYIITGGCGFIGSHLVDSLINAGHEVIVLDNLLSGYQKNLNPKATFHLCDIRNFDSITQYFNSSIDGVYHLGAIPRTPWCIDNPILAYQTNVMGTLHVLEACRLNNIKRVVLTSSNVIYAFWTPYRSTKEGLESLSRVYNDMYGMSTVCLRNSNVYGSRQSEQGPSPNVLSSLRKCKKENGYINITGDGEQSRDFTHVSDIVNGHIMAMNTSVTGVFDLCTGVNTTMNEIASYFNCPINYIPDRPGDIKHIYQDPKPAFDAFGWKATVSLADGIQDFFNDTSYT